ncbi:recombinase family protein [Streptomyces sp. McG3]|uniref:recombinase family protein n=1 Tax=Streptomyces sp. McG3 TaxID=2725483 RepID=UPI001BEB11C1|nr:recombinase family protein [Streptomyces sp. McG3]MBT2896657.1 recombinase family protein [Streptomyces sp. McG3]
MSSELFPAPGTGCAIYLRCFPYDIWAMESHRLALTDYARQLNLFEPAVYSDNGARSGSPLCRFEALVSAVQAGWYRTVLVTGPWVFDRRAQEAEGLMGRLTDSGCTVLELPRLRRPRSVAASDGRPPAPDTLLSPLL